MEGGLHVLILIIAQAPPAIVRGRFDVDRTSAIYGFPARVVGVLLCSLLALVVIDLIVAAIKRFNDAWIFASLAHFVGTVVVCALLCIVFREKRRDL